METVRGLLTLGNSKVGESIHLWSLPAVLTCPGRSSVCERWCYATKHRYQFESVQGRLLWNLEQSRQKGWVDRMVKEIRQKGCLVIRVHGSGDYYDAEYAEKWLAVMGRCTRPQFYFYTRSWRDADIAGVLEEMADLEHVSAWYSVDAETGNPAVVPPNVRLAYLQTETGEKPEGVDLVFRVRGLRSGRIPLTLACPSEVPRGRDREITCGSCSKCWRG
jgi:hypothetical protein